MFVGMAEGDEVGERVLSAEHCKHSKQTSAAESICNSSKLSAHARKFPLGRPIPNVEHIPSASNTSRSPIHSGSESPYTPVHNNNSVNPVVIYFIIFE